MPRLNPAGRPFAGRHHPYDAHNGGHAAPDINPGPGLPFLDFSQYQMPSTDIQQRPPTPGGHDDDHQGGQVPPAPAPNAPGDNFVGGNTNQQPPGRTLQTFKVPDGFKTRRLILESTYKVRSKIDALFEADKLRTIPWESMRLCHHDNSYLNQMCEASGWRPVKCRVEIFNMRAHAEISVAANSFYPINLDQVRARYIDHSYPIAARIGTIENKAQYDAWIKVLDNQKDGLQDSDLPLCEMSVGTEVTYNRKVYYDEQFWVSKKVQDDEMLEFEWVAGDVPWRHTNEIYNPLFMKHPQGNGIPATLKYGYSIFDPRFDYRFGAIDPPFSPPRYYKLKTAAQTDSGQTRVSCRLTPIWASNTKGLIKVVNENEDSLARNETATDEVFNIAKLVEYGKAFGDNCFHSYDLHIRDYSDGIKEDLFSQMHPVPFPTIYSDDNVMKPIVLDFSRFMKQDNVQEYRVYYEIRIVHEIDILEPKHFFQRNAHDIKSFPNVGAKYRLLGSRINAPVIYSSTTAELAESHFGQTTNRRAIRYYRPTIEPIYHAQTD